MKLPSRAFVRFRRFVGTWLIHRHLPLLLAVLAVLLVSPALVVGWQLDDHFHRLVMTRGAGGNIGPMEAFSSLRGDAAENRRLTEWGVLPWWTPEDLRLAFFRPLSLLSASIDYRLWPSRPSLMHAHSLLWLGLGVAAAAVLYRRVMGRGAVAGIAALLFAMDDAHAIPAAWLANRNALLATFFGILCLLAHDRWRRGKAWRWAVTGSVSLAAALASGELALATAGYLVAYALFLDGAGKSRSLASLLPYGGVLSAWAILYRWGGFGTAGSGLYIDPVRDPWEFFRAAVERVPFLLLGQWSPILADWGPALSPGSARILWVVAVALIAVLVFAFGRQIAREREARFWCVGMCLSLIPIAATFPSNRLLLFVGLGAMPLLARFLAEVFSLDSPRPVGSSFRRGLAVGLIGVHLVLAPLAAPVSAWSVTIFGEPMVRAITSLPEDPNLAKQDLVIVNAPDYLLFVSNIPTLLALEGRPLPRRVRGLAIAPSPVRVTRLDDRTVRVRIDKGLFSGMLGRLFRGEQRPMEPHQVIELDGMSATLVELGKGGSPVEVDYRFARVLEDPSLRWVRWSNGMFVPFALPVPSESIDLPPALSPWEVFRAGE